MITTNGALDWLLEKGYFDKDDDGWCSPVKPPSDADLPNYVQCVSGLGRQSVALGTSKPAIWVRFDGPVDAMRMQFKSSSKA